MPAHERCRPSIVPLFERVEDFEMLAAGGDDAVVAIGPGIVLEATDLVLLLDRAVEEDVSRAGREHLVEVGVHFEKANDRDSARRGSQRSLMLAPRSRRPDRIERE